MVSSTSSFADTTTPDLELLGKTSSPSRVRTTCVSLRSGRCINLPRKGSIPRTIGGEESNCCSSRAIRREALPLQTAKKTLTRQLNLDADN